MHERHVTQTVVATVVLALSVGALATAASPAHAFDDDRFTLVVLPDTQGYTGNTALAPTMGAQTQWIANQKGPLSIAFVAQVGDLVESHPNVTQWQRASQYMKTLDDAGVPSAVLPGNHDMNVATGDAPRFDEYFPPSRYSQATWNSATASYGGYLGQNLFGQDPVNRGNKDSFSLFKAGGLDFLLLSLEYDPTDDVLAWAKKVIDAHPARKVILSTHSFIHTAGGRSSTTTRTGPGVNTPQQVWTKLVQPNCSIFMVVNGHWHDGDLGEARRTDDNACGKPVHQVLSNYQERINGGDGWLRYYTFDPSEDTIDARTYSPTLDRFETDANSQFTLSHDMTPPTASDRTLIASGASWAWRYSNAAPPANWTGTSFDDSSWAHGPATLGFGSYGPTTNIDVPPPTSDRPRSAQFRRSFTVEAPSTLTDITLTTRANDGIALYLNGTELRRVNLPTGTLAHTTYATAAPSNTTATNNPVTFTVPASALRTGTNTLAASVHLNYRATPDIAYDLKLTAKETGPPPPPPPPPVDTTLIASGASWAWRYSNAAAPANWTGTSFDDSSWAHGPATLGFGSYGPTTNIDVPPPTSDRPRSAQFRRSFTVEAPSTLTDITLTTRANDGIALYLNGTELRRVNLPTGTLAHTTYATAAPSNTTATNNPVTFTVPASALRTGTNTLAASVHLNYRATPDIAYDLKLTAKRPGP